MRVIGAGFSGLIAAYELTQRGYSVSIYEKQNRVGGLISTQSNQFGFVETAANGVLNTFAFEKLCRELEVPLVKTKAESKKRYIFRDGKPQRWPLGFSSTAKLLWGFSRIKKPVPGETIADWGRKNFNQEAVSFLLAPALQGIYAGDVEQMSSSLILNRFFLKQRRRRPMMRGLVSPQKGMGQLMEALRERLSRDGAVFYMDKTLTAKDVPSLSKTVVATSADVAAELLAEASPQDSALLKKIEMLPLVRATLFFKTHRSLKGFGCLFSPSENTHALGVLFDDSIFEREASMTTESWILGGAKNKTVYQLSDDQIIEKILGDRFRLLGVKEEPTEFVITRWPQALPHYSCELEEILQQLSPEVRKHLVGNYLGKIGLSQILEQTQEQVRSL